MIGLNMYAYCGNNPVNRFDPTGQDWNEIWEFVKTAVSEIGNAISRSASAYASCVGIAMGDGPLLAGDAIGIACATAITIGAVGYGIYQAAQNPSFSISKLEKESADRRAKI